MSNPHIVVTGAGTGIGRAIARRLGRRGARLTLMARRTDRLHDTAQRIADAGGTPAHVVACDLTDPTTVESAFASATEHFGPLTAVVANAGIGGPNDPGPGDRWDEIVNTNLTGTYRTLRAAQRRLAPGPGARHMVVVASILGRIGVPGYTAYCASKAGLLGLTRALSVELVDDGIQVNAICPGWVDTDMAREGLEGMATAMGITYDQAKARAMEAVPAGRMSSPDEIAGVVAWLLSDDARGMVGQAVDVNGGAFMV